MLAFYYAMWCAGALLKAAAVCRMAKNGIARRYVLLAVFLAACSLRTLVLVFLWQHQAQYRRVYEASMPILNLLECAAVVGVFWVLVENYRNFRKIGIVGLSALAIAGLGAAWVTRHWGLPISVGLREIALLWERQTSLVLVGVLAGIALLLPRSRYLPLRVSAQRAIAILTVEEAEVLLLASIGMIAKGAVTHSALWVRWTYTLFPMALRIGIGALWLFWMTPASDAEPKIVVLSDEDLERHARESKLRLHLIEAEMRNVLRDLD